MTSPSLSSLEKPAQPPNSSGELADGAQETPPALPFRYPGNFIGKSVSNFGRRFPIPKRKNLRFVTHTHAVFGTLWHGCRLSDCPSGFYVHHRFPVIHLRM